MTLSEKKGNMLYWGLVALVLYMPFHYYFAELLLRGTGWDNILRDLLILALTGLVLLNRDIFSDLQCYLVAGSSVMLAVLGILSAVVHQLFPVLNILRTYLIPMLVFFVAKCASFDRSRFDRLNTLLSVQLALVAIYGFFQAFFLKDDFLILLGYPSKDGVLDSFSYYISHFFGYQRSVGTFVSPNICGIILAVALCVLLFTDRNRSFRWMYLWGTLLLIGLIATFSRSAMLGFACATFFYWLIAKSWTRLSKKTVRRVLLIAGTAGLFLLLDQLLWDGLFLKMLLSTIFRTFNGEDPSANAHAEHLLSPPDLNQGSGRNWIRFGLNGPMAEEFLASPFKVESSLYLMVYELGILGALLYFSPYVLIILQTVFNRKHYAYFAPAAASIAVLVSYVFLPNVQTFEVPFYVFLLIGLYCNSSVRQLYTGREEASQRLSLRELLKTAAGTVKRLPLLLLQHFPRSRNIYIFGAWSGQKFSDNSRALFLYALAHTDKKCFWICKNRAVYERMKQANLPVLMAHSPKGLYYQLRAGVAFSCVGDYDFCRQMLGGCVHVELWHGVGGCKKIGMDDREYRQQAMTHRMRFYSQLEAHALRKHYFIYTSEETKKVFRSAFGVPEHLFIHAGQPRNDMFFDPDYRPETIDHAEFGGKKVIVYMPTHRKTGQVRMDMSQLLDLEALNAFCRDNNAVFLIKKHFYHGGETEDLTAYPHIIDITARAVDSNELLLAADYLISDYSSCTGDYLLLDRPVFFYCYDYADYISQDREMYWDFESVTPGDHCQTFPELLACLKKTVAEHSDPHAPERKRVRDMYYDTQCQGMAAASILAQVEEILK